MVSAGRQMMGLMLGFTGFVGTVVVCALPMWKVTAFINANIITAQVTWEGLWMNCVVQTTGQMQCKVYDSVLILNEDLQAARALVVVAIGVGIFAIVLGAMGGKCTNFVDNESSKARVGVSGGVMFIVSGVLVLVPVCWTAHNIIRDFYNPQLLDASLFVGGAAAGLLFLGGGLLCSSCPRNREVPYGAKYSQARPGSSQAYV
ncbi:claudin-4-like [Denticeps clupeoides]|uniref:claudin-4-like n=1 Tax=Denticeps clupeoides TaxID=299321 RepID=UPI0010A3FB32|nr:claudin-4-like [Denticeps clupeoides]